MIYKKYDQLSGYLIAPDATVIEIETYEVVKPEKVLTGWGVKLLTDEVPASFRGLKKPLQLVRSFSREELLKMYARSKNEFHDDMEAIPYTKAFKMIETGHQLHKAILEGKPSKDPVVNKIKDAFMSEATEITPEMMARLSNRDPLPAAEPGSLDAAHEKASVKPKKATKSIRPSKDKKVAEDLVQDVVNKNLHSGSPDPRLVMNHLKGSKPMKFPFIKIDGISYQSARKASEALKVSVNTVLRKAKANKDGWFYIEK